MHARDHERSRRPLGPQAVDERKPLGGREPEAAGWCPRASAGARRSATGTLVAARSATAASRRSSSSLSIATVAPARCAQLEQRTGLHGRGHDEVGRRDAALQRLSQFALARDIDPEPDATRLVDEGERLVGLAREVDLQVGAYAVGLPLELARVTGERGGVEHVERRSVPVEPAAPADPADCRARSATAPGERAAGRCPRSRRASWCRVLLSVRVLMRTPPAARRGARSRGNARGRAARLAAPSDRAAGAGSG